MADVTISQLTKGTPAGNNILPYSTGSNTLGVPVSALFQNTTKIGFNTTDPLYSYHLIYNESTDIPGLMLRNNTTPGIAYLSVNTISNNCGIKSYNSAHPTKPSYNEIGNWSAEGQLSLVVRNETRMHIDGFGRITKPYQPYLYVSVLGTNPSQGGGSYNYTPMENFSNLTSPLVPYNNIVKQTGGSNFNTSSFTYTIPVNGIYLITAGVASGNINGVQTANISEIWLVVNGSRKETIANFNTVSPNIPYTSILHGSGAFYFTAGQAVGVKAYGTSAAGSVLEDNHHSFFSITLLG